jgi:hypothetical protein
LQSGDARVECGHLILRIQHLSKLPYERQHWIFLPILEQTLKELEARRLEGVASTFASEKLILNGPGEFARLDWRDRTAAAQRIRQGSTALQKAEQAEMGHHPDGVVRSLGYAAVFSTIVSLVTIELTALSKSACDEVN